MSQVSLTGPQTTRRSTCPFNRDLVFTPAPPQLNFRIQINMRDLVDIWDKNGMELTGRKGLCNYFSTLS